MTCSRMLGRCAGCAPPLRSTPPTRWPPAHDRVRRRGHAGWHWQLACQCLCVHNGSGHGRTSRLWHPAKPAGMMGTEIWVKVGKPQRGLAFRLRRAPDRLERAELPLRGHAHDTHGRLRWRRRRLNGPLHAPLGCPDRRKRTVERNGQRDDRGVGAINRQLPAGWSAPAVGAQQSVPV